MQPYIQKRFLHSTTRSTQVSHLDDPAKVWGLGLKVRRSSGAQAVYL
jgi:hypothetical protein